MTQSSIPLITLAAAKLTALIPPPQNRSSVVTGPYGTGQEYGGGLNWYLKQSRQARLTFETIHMNNNPAQNLLYPYRAGYSGTAIQTQLMVIF